MASTRWSAATKFWVITFGTVLAGLVAYRLRHLIPLVGLAALLAYILNPLVNLIVRRGRLNRTLATAVVYLGLLALVAIIPAVFVPSLLEQAHAIDREVLRNLVQGLVLRIRTYGQHTTLHVFGVAIDLSPLYDPLASNLEQFSSSLASRSVGFLLSFASGFAATVVGLVVILVLSFYMVRDAQNIIAYLENLVPELYRDEVVGMAQEISRIWRDFFRGQLTLCAVVGVATGIGLAVLGVPNALLLGILAGVLELIPNLGPTLAAIPALIIAFFQGSTHFAISNVWFTLIVALLYVVIQQVENNVLVPRIIGGSVHLHPVVVLIGVLAGASVAGVLGIFLAAPVIASVRVLGRYAYEKLVDVPIPAVPYEDYEEGASEAPEEAALMPLPEGYLPNPKGSHPEEHSEPG